MGNVRAPLVWIALAIMAAVPLIAAAFSPFLAYRDPVYIAAGFAGVIAMVLLLVQPLLVGGFLPGLTGMRGRYVHRWTGSLLVAAIVAHVAGLWITSPPDVVDALLFTSPTPFSAWGVIAMWAVFAAALLATLRSRLRLQPKTWRNGHTALVIIAVIGSVVHALQIEGTMETYSKAALCILTLAATLATVARLRAWSLARRRPGS